jgi:NADH-quinone oxidoreductase subunit C
MKAEEIAALLDGQFGARILESRIDGLSPHSVVEPPEILAVCCFLKEDPRLAMDHLECLAGVDYRDRVEVVYVVFSMQHRHRYALKCRMPREAPSLPSVESVWGVANWHEREAYDMMGIVFQGHSDFRRILLPDDWEGYPLRKDYQAPKTYLDMPV